MRILFVGGIYHVELSLVAEALHNPDIEIMVCVTNSPRQCGAPASAKVRIVNSRADVDRVKAEFNPDLTIFRCWCASENWAQEGEYIWNLEIFQSNAPNAVKKHVPHITSQAKQLWLSKPDAQAKGELWLPYCVSKHFEKPSAVKDLPIVVATSMPGNTLKNKGDNMDILLKPIVEKDASLVHAYQGVNKGLARRAYIIPCLKPSFAMGDAPKIISRYKIYMSPSSIMWDEGYYSHKTLQAMACGVLTFTNKYVGIEEVFGKDGDTIVYSNSAEETLEKVDYYLNNDAARERVACRGYEFVHEEYNWEKHFTRLITEIR